MDIKTLPILRKSHAQSRSLKLRFCLQRHQFIVTTPPRIRKKDVDAFLHQHTDWMEKQLAKHEKSDDFKIGDTVNLFGDTYGIAHDPLRKTGIFESEDAILIGGRHVSSEDLQKLFIPWMKKKSHGFFIDRAQEYASQLGVTFNRVSVRDTTSRWGSCSTRGTLSFSWRLILAPLSVADYIAVHEVCHLKEMNHSPD